MIEIKITIKKIIIVAPLLAFEFPLGNSETPLLHVSPSFKNNPPASCATAANSFSSRADVFRR
jgi:hypothetical protein